MNEPVMNESVMNGSRVNEYVMNYSFENEFFINVSLMNMVYYERVNESDHVQNRLVHNRPRS